MHAKLEATGRDSIRAERFLTNSSYTTPRVVRQKDMVMSPAGPGTRNDCAGEDQHKFIRPTDQPNSY
jgi:hypothetical protein